MGRVAAKMYTVTGTSMPAEMLRPTTVIHHFPTHAARTGAVERSDERLNTVQGWSENTVYMALLYRPQAVRSGVVLVLY